MCSESAVDVTQLYFPRSPLLPPPTPKRMKTNTNDGGAGKRQAAGVKAGVIA